MIFTTDRQTLDDLNIFGKAGQHSVYGLFNNTHTRGGSAVMTRMFEEPLGGEALIRKRIGVFRYFVDKGGIQFPFEPEWFDNLEQYLANTDERTKLSMEDAKLGTRLAAMVSVDTEKATILKGIASAIEIAHTCSSFLESLGELLGAFKEEAQSMLSLLLGPAFLPLLQQPQNRKLTAATAVEMDELLRFRHRFVVRRLMDYVYSLDVYLTVAKVAAARNFVFPTVMDREEKAIRLKGVYHPALSNPVSNAIDITAENNVVFLTGANMAGKSTFMKSLGIAVFLAHMGFPVPAEKMEFSVLGGLFTTINLPDNLGMGASHFYAEVLRVKKVAEELNRGRDLLVIFDELFRGTNVKDAYEGTVAIAEAFASRRSSIFVISTHIIEAGEDLRQRCGNICFRYLPTRMKEGVPVYTYQLEEGITDDRHGMVIIRNEGVLDLLRQEGRSETRSFIVDSQTLNDLNLLGKHRRQSVFSLFNSVRTAAGERLLELMFRHPLREVDEISNRTALFRHFGSQSLEFPLSAAAFEEMENYLEGDGAFNLVAAVAGMVRRRASASLLKDLAYQEFEGGVTTTVGALKVIYSFLTDLLARDPHGPFSYRIRKAVLSLEGPSLSFVQKDKFPLRKGATTLARYDYALRTVCKKELLEIRDLMAELDVFIAVGNVGRTNGWTYAKARPAATDVLRLEGLRHPALPKGVGNRINLDGELNVLFLTGANMAGKSTLMKSFGIAVYMAHMGFPVAADDMEFSVRDGIYSSINVADDLNQGYSHFYAEVVRVKTVAKAVSEGRRLVVLFDELFKGTNVKDAFDGTVAVTEAFSQHKRSAFIISTHIVEAGEALLEEAVPLWCAYLPTLMDGGKPRYTYVLQPGIAADRVGMTIIENEGILNTIRQNVKKDCI